MPATRELSFAAHRSRPRADPGFEKPKEPLTFSLSLSLSFLASCERATVSRSSSPRITSQTRPASASAGAPERDLCPTHKFVL